MNDLEMIAEAIRASVLHSEESKRTEWEDIAIAICRASSVRHDDIVREIRNTLATLGVDQ